MSGDLNRAEKELVVGEKDDGTGLLSFLSSRLIGLSKRRLRRLIAAGRIRVNGASATPAGVVRAGDVISLPQEAWPPGNTAPWLAGVALGIEVLHEDEAHVVVNKPAGYAVIPARDGGERLFFESLMGLVNRNSPPGGPYVRPHIVHRLDRETSGALVVAKDAESSRALSRQFERGQVSKTYLGIIEGRLPRRELRVEIPLARAATSVLKMQPDERRGKRAVTLIALKESFQHFSLVQIRPLTGRQHQIRVHLAAIGYPLAADFLYGRRDKLTGPELNRIVGASVTTASVVLDRCPLHAAAIAYRHPRSAEPMHVEAPLSEDMEKFLQLLRRVDVKGP